jgi:protein TonB
MYRFFKTTIPLVAGLGCSMALFLTLPLLNGIGQPRAGTDRRSDTGKLLVRRVEPQSHGPAIPPAPTMAFDEQQPSLADRLPAAPPRLDSGNQPSRPPQIDLDLEQPSPPEAGMQPGSLDALLAGVRLAGPYAVQADGDRRPLREFAADYPPHELTRLSPRYPEAARQQGIEGTVVVHLLIDEAGSIEAMQPVEVTGHPSFRAAVLAMADQWRFSPPSHQGRPVKIWATKTVEFRLR